MSFSTTTRRTLALIGAAAIFSTSAAPAQFDSQNVTLLAHMPLNVFPSNPSSGNDCWGYVSPSGREYALMGLRNALAVVEITNPRSPVIVASIPHTSSLWAGIKVYRDHCYVSNEAGGGIQVISLANVDNGEATLVRNVTYNGLSTTHTLAVDEHSGYLYLAGANINGGSLVCFDVSDPSNPVFAGQFSGPYTHEAQVVTYTQGQYAGRQIAFCYNGRTAFDILDVTNKAAMFRIGRNVYEGLNYCHQGWLTEDRQYVVLNDELDEQNGYTNVTLSRVFDVSDLSAPTLAATFTTGLPSIDHNLYINGNYCYESNYTTGLRIFDVTDPLNAVETGWIDTYPENNGQTFNGTWSNFPFFPSGTVIISDINRGMFIVDASAARASLTFLYPGGRPEMVLPSGGTRMRVDVEARGSDPQPGTGILHFNGGSGWTSIPMDILGPNSYDAVFPPSTCGNTVQYYVSAETDRGQVVYDPPGAPVVTYTAMSASDLNVFHVDDFNVDRGWTVQNENVTDGAWVRAIPAQNGSRGDPPTDSDGSGWCFVTGNGPNQDLDGGPTHINSPLFDLSGRGAVMVSFDRWFYNDDQDDFLIAYVSNNGGTNWVEMWRTSHDPGWKNQTFIINDFVNLTSTMRFRFTTSDNPNNSVTEAGIDAFKLLDVRCGGGPAFTLAVTGECRTQGGGRFTWSGAQPGNTLALIFARNTGSFRVPNNNPCAGTELGLGSNQIQLARTFNSGSGAGFFNATLPNGACGGYFQLLQLSDCATSNVAQAPN